MAKKVGQIRIQSIEDGMSVYNFVAGENQFFDSVNIDPDANDASNDGRGAGFTTLTPNRPQAVTGDLTGVPLWMVGAPRHDTNSSHELYVYDMNGSVYTISSSTITALGDLNDGGSASGNGCAYYDNYIYFARDTTVARYGPLNGTASFADDYWITTLGKPALGNQAYHTRNSGYTDAKYPNHVLHRHTDGRLYIADVVGNQGSIHYIQTSKTTVEGDTDDGSKYQALDLPYGYYPTDIESYGDDLVISAFEGREDTEDGVYNSSTSYEGRSALFFWDTVSDSYYKIIQNEFPDQIITALENANGVLYTFSSGIAFQPTGVRVCRYLGGNSFEQILLMSDADTPFAGGTEARLNQVYFTSDNQHSDSRACVWSIGSQNRPLSNAVFNVVGARMSTGAGHAIAFGDGLAPWASELYYSYASNNSSATVEVFGGNSSLWDTDLNNGWNAYWASNWYTIGQKFKIDKIRLNILRPDIIDSGTDITVFVYVDRSETASKTFSINNDTYPSKRGAIVLRPDGLIGEHSVQIQIWWGGVDNDAVALPITIDYEVIENE